MLEYYRFKSVLDLFLKGRETEAREELSALQRRYVALCDENLAYKMQLQEYEDVLYLARNLIFDGRFYWLVTGSIRQGPFCPDCYNRDGLLMRLSGEPEDRRCSYCRRGFHVHEEQPAFMATALADGSTDTGVYEPPPVEARKAKIISFHR